MEIKRVEKNSLAEKHNLFSGDDIIKINNKLIRDVIDYRYYLSEEQLELQIKDKKGRIKKIRIKKRLDQDLGIVLKEDPYRRCPNKCIFCFVDQLPKGLRKSLYFKDEDYRLSFLHGNFITLTNLSDDDIRRIVKQRISPLYVSVHTTDEDLRKIMLGNPKIPKLVPLIEELAKNRIELHTQIVLCPGINNGDNLKKTVFDLAGFYPYVRSLAIVPVGLTRFRENLPRISGVSKQYSKEIINKVKKWQKQFRDKFRENFLYLSDEFFLKAGIDIPDVGYYDDFFQIENGVGLVRKFIDDFKTSSYLLPEKLKRKTEITLVTGKLSAKFIRKMVNQEIKRIKNLKVKIVEVKNEFFGNMVTVSGLLAGEDIIQALKKEKKPGEIILLPPNCVNTEDKFLDNLTPKDLQRKFKRKVVVGSYDFVNTFLDILKVSKSI
jgi:putative radical SAM enzyme (TIGR03279 family)